MHSYLLLALLFLNHAERKLPEQVQINASRSRGRSFFKNMSKWPEKRTLSVINAIIGPVIHIPQRQDSFGQKKPNILPPEKYIKARINGKGSISGIKGTRSPKLTASI
jgi:hypothetical protein